LVPNICKQGDHYKGYIQTPPIFKILSDLHFATGKQFITTKWDLVWDMG